MKSLYLLFLFIGFAATSQITKSITIESLNAKTVTVPFSDLKKHELHSIDSLQILNHMKEYKSTLKNIKGVLLKDVLENISFSEESPKVLSEYYIICVADDGYKVVFSWNEIFNSPTGNSILVLTDVNGETAINQKQGIRLVTTTDFATGRRYVKNLKTIKIERVK